MKRWIVVICVVVAVAAAGTWAVRRVRSASTPQRATYATAVAKVGDLEVSVSGTGNLASTDRRVVKSAVEGKVSQLPVKEGASVKAGQVIAVLSNPDLVQQYQQAKLDLESQRLKFEASRSPTSAQVAQVESAYSQAQTSLAARKKDIQNLTVTSPANGRVQAVTVNAGDSVSAGQSLLKVVDDTEITVAASITQTDLPRVKVGQTAWVVFGSEFPDAWGVVNSIGTQGAVSGKSTVVPVYIKIANPSGVYRSGLSANVGIKVSSDESIYGSATASPRATYDVRAEVKGTVVEIAVSEGMSVTKGKTLAKLSNSDLQPALEKAESDLKTAQENLDRIRSGLAANITEVDIKQQEVSLQRAEAAVTSKAEQVASLEIKSPINGVVLSRSIGVGDEVVAAGQLFVVSDLSSMQIVIAVDELDIVKVKLGQQATVVMDALPTKSYTADVTRIAGEGTVRDGVANYDVTLTLKNPEGLMPGMTANATIILDSKKGALLVPSEAIRTSGARRTVTVLKNGATETVQVSIGLRNDVMTEVLTGLKEGDTVVLSSLTRQQEQQRMMPGGVQFKFSPGPR
jgi:HlyD family secretion protein